MQRFELRVALKWLVVIVAACAGTYLIWLIYLSGQVLWAVLALALLALAFFVYCSNIAFAYRYLFPGLAGMAVFVVFPILYTAQIGFTNYSSTNLLSFERATAYLLEQTQPDEGAAYAFSVHPESGEFRLRLQPKAEEEDEDDRAKQAAADARTFVTPALALIAPTPPDEIKAVSLKDAHLALSEPLSLGDVIKRRDVLTKLRIRLPDGALLTYAGVREFAPQQPVYRESGKDELTQVKSGKVYHANATRGFYEDATGERLQPGFKVGIGFGNYGRMLNDPEFRGPFLRIFFWTVTFAAMTVLLTLAVGCTLAVVLNWEALRFRTVYRTLLFLPYAVPGFISILVFKGLFNRNFGEINLILEALLGIRPDWTGDAILARIMILIVNTWLGYPYFMLMCMGLQKSIPHDLYEASALAGAGPLTNFYRITWPLIRKPLTPLLVASFAYNFNNFVLIFLLTKGKPDFLDTAAPAGETDVLVTYTYRTAFDEHSFGLAAAISTIIFAIVAILSVLNLRLTKATASDSR